MARSHRARLAILAGFVALGSGLWLVERSDPHARDPRDGDALVETSTRLEPPSLIPDAGGSHRTNPDECRVARESRPLHIEGRLEVQGLGNADFVPERAMFQLDAGDGRPPVRVFARDGRWSAEVSAEICYSVEALTIEGQGADPEPRSVLPTSSGEELVLRAALRSKGELRVLDGEMGRDARGITVVFARSFAHADLSYPPLELCAAPALVDARSPVPMPDVPGVNTYWLRNAGSAWEQVAFSGDGGMRTIELEAGGTLDVRVEGELAGRAGRFRLLAGAEGGVQLEEPVRSPGSLTLVGLRAGSYTGQLLSIPRSGPPRVLGEEALEIGPDTAARIDFTIDPRAFEDTGSLAGAVLLPEGGPPTRSWLVFRETEAPTSEAFRVGVGSAKGTSDSLRWRAQDVPAGVYEVQLEPAGFRSSVVCVAGEERWLDLDLQDLAWVIVNPFDTQDGGTMPESLVWRRVVDDGSAGWNAIGRSPSASRFEFVVHPGEIELTVADVGSTSDLQRHAVHAGPNDLVLPFRSRAPCSLDVAVRCETVEVPLAASFWNGIECSPTAGGPGEIVGSRASAEAEAPSTSRAAANLTLLFGEPGQFRLDFPSVPGFQPIAPHVVDVSRESATRLELELVAAP
jgi:hypothetical protein